MSTLKIVITIIKSTLCDDCSLQFLFHKNCHAYTRNTQKKKITIAGLILI